MPFSLPKSNRTDIRFSYFFFLISLVYIFIYTKIDSFLIINSNHNDFFDFFFYYITYLGDGSLWVVVGVIILIFRKKYFVLILLCIFFSTLLVNLFKQIILPDSLSPVSLVQLGYNVHFVIDVNVHSLKSFPSGHTTQAFTMCFILNYIFRNKISLVAFPILAYLVGYSRVYLGLHYPVDVVAGILFGYISFIVSVGFFLKLSSKLKLDRIFHSKT